MGGAQFSTHREAAPARDPLALCTPLHQTPAAGCLLEAPLAWAKARGYQGRVQPKAGSLQRRWGGSSPRERGLGCSASVSCALCGVPGFPEHSLPAAGSSPQNQASLPQR